MFVLSLSYDNQLMTGRKELAFSTCCPSLCISRYTTLPVKSGNPEAPLIAPLPDTLTSPVFKRCYWFANSPRTPSCDPGLPFSFHFIHSQSGLFSAQYCAPCWGAARDEKGSPVPVCGWQLTKGFKCRERNAGDKAGSARCSVTYTDGMGGMGVGGRLEGRDICIRTDASLCCITEKTL